jgi:hypothetical protein
MSEEENWKLRSMERKRLSHHINQMNPCILKALSGRHILIIGSSGSGKTYAAAYMAQKTDCFVFLNVQRERSVSNVCQVSLEEPSEIQEALEEGYRQIEFIPSMNRDEARAEVQILRESIFEIGTEIKAESKELEIPFWINCFLDEFQLFAPKHSHLDGEIFFTQGRGLGIRSIAISRAPQEISSEVVNNVENELIFRLGHYSEPYYKTYKIPIEEYKDYLSNDHYFVLYDKYQITGCGVL